ncbi:MAG: FAD-binding protein [Clostridia bacterium]|nr:FAD-binding protein [Clostridia bacterium]
MKDNCHDIIIVGSGAAGLFAALNFEKNQKVLVLTKDKKDLSNSSLAQGGIACVLSFDNDSFDLHIEDTMIAGRRENDIEAVTTLVHEGPDQVRKLMDMGLNYDKNADGTPTKTLEGGHCRNRIIHCKDYTGKEVIRTLLNEVEKRDNITICENTAVINMTKISGGFALETVDKENNHHLLYTKYCLLATGGLGRAYRYTTNPIVATGDGIRLAHDLGAVIKNLSYVQFHPTAFNDKKSNEQFLISEAVRGEGAYLLNYKHERFMDKYDERLELAPRDVVSKSIVLESRRTGSNDFFLDIRYKGKEFLDKRFPGITEGCAKYGVDISKDLIPIFPCQHYLMGGIDVDLNGQTTMSHLFAAGECAHTGVHGKNRLASNSLLEALVFGARAAKKITSLLKEDDTKLIIPDIKINASGAPVEKGIKNEVQNILQKSCFVIPDEAQIRKNLPRVEEITKRLKRQSYAKTKKHSEILSISTMASLILKDIDI